MTERDLKRRISDALLAGGLDKDAGLAELLAADPEAAAYARDAEKVDGLLRGWPQPARGDDGWEALASRIDQRLKDPLRAPGDMTLPPRFDDDDPFVREPRGAVGAARPGGLPPRAVTPSPLKPPPGAKPFTPSKPGGTKSPLVAPAKAAAPVAPPIAAKVEAEAPRGEAPAVVEAVAVVAVEVAVAIDEPQVDVPELAPPPPGVTGVAPEAHASEAVAAAPEPAPPATRSEPPMPISLPPDAPRESVPSLVPEADSKALTLANLSNLDVKAHAPPPVPAAAHAKPPPTPRAKTAQRKDDRAEIASVAQPLLELPTFDSPIAAATKQAAKKASRAPLYGTLALAASVALGVGGWWVITQGGGADQQVAMAPPPAESNTTVEGEMPADRLGPMMPAATPGSQAPTMPPAVTVSPPAPVAVADGTAAGDDQRARGELGGTPATGAVGMGGVPATTPTDPRLAVAETDTGAAATAHHAAPRPHGGVGGGGGGAIVGGGGHAAPTGGAAESHDAPPPPPTHHGHASAGAGGGSSDQPPREEIVRAMGSVRSAVVACAAGRGGVAWVQVTFAGPTGRVSNALVQGTFAGTPQGSCIARAVRGGQVPSFHAATFTVAYPFQL